jgi:hypothetical protein
MYTAALGQKVSQSSSRRPYVRLCLYQCSTPPSQLTRFTVHNNTIHLRQPNFYPHFLSRMTRLVHYEDSRPSMDHFGDTLVHDPYETYDKTPRYGDNSTIATGYTSGVPVPEPKEPSNLYGQTEAENLASQYKQHSSLPSPGADTNTTNRLTYIDEDFNYYPSKPSPAIDDKQDAPLVHNVANVGRSGSYQDLEYADPYNENSKDGAEKAPLARFMESAKYPLDQRIEDKKHGVGRQRYPFLCTLFQSPHNQYQRALKGRFFKAWILTAVMISVFIYELVVQSKAQGTPVSFKVRTFVYTVILFFAYSHRSRSSTLCWVLHKVHSFNLAHVFLRA